MRFLDKKVGLISIPIALIDAPTCPNRDEVDLNKINELAQRIDKYGQLVPIIVRKKYNGRYERIAGFRRIEAHKLLNLKEIEAAIYDVTDEEMCMMMFEENNKRESNGVIDVLKMHIYLIEMRVRKRNTLAKVHVAQINFAQLLITACRKIETAHKVALKKEAGTYNVSKSRTKPLDSNLKKVELELEDTIKEVVQSFGHYKSISSFRTQLYYLEMEPQIIELISAQKLSLAAGIELNKCRNKSAQLSPEQKETLLNRSVEEGYSKKQVSECAKKMLSESALVFTKRKFLSEIEHTFNLLYEIDYESLSKKNKDALQKAMEKITGIAAKEESRRTEKV